jgi:hypothetical protein
MAKVGPGLKTTEIRGGGRIPKFVLSLIYLQVCGKSCFSFQKSFFTFSKLFFSAGLWLLLVQAFFSGF